MKCEKNFNTNILITDKMHIYMRIYIHTHICVVYRDLASAVMQSWQSVSHGWISEYEYEHGWMNEWAMGTSKCPWNYISLHINFKMIYHFKTTLITIVHPCHCKKGGRVPCKFYVKDDGLQVETWGHLPSHQDLS